MILARSHKVKWNQPFFYDSDVPVIKELLKSIIISIDSIGFKVGGFVCNKSPCNRQLFSELFIIPVKTYSPKQVVIKEK